MEDHFESVVTIVLNSDDSHMMGNVLGVLRTAGMQIDGTDEENGVIEATGPSETVKQLERVHLFEYIRTNFSFWKHEPKTARVTDGEMVGA